MKGRKRTPHFRWRYSLKGDVLTYRFYFCIGGETVAAWPSSASYEELIYALVYTKMLTEGKSRDVLSTNQSRVRSMALRLRDALLKAEQGTRGQTIARQRRRLDRWLYGADSWQCAPGDSEIQKRLRALQAKRIKGE